jgi:hypothetical protein
LGAILAARIREQCVCVYFRLDRRWVGHEISAEAGVRGLSYSELRQTVAASSGVTGFIALIAAASTIALDGVRRG